MLGQLRRQLHGIAAVAFKIGTIDLQRTQAERKSDVLAHLLVSRETNGHRLLHLGTLESGVSCPKSSEVAAHRQRTHCEILEWGRPWSHEYQCYSCATAPPEDRRIVWYTT